MRISRKKFRTFFCDICWEGFVRWERKGRVMGVLKEWKAGEKKGNYPAMFKICNRKMAK